MLRAASTSRTSLAILTKKSFQWLLSIASGALGAVAAVFVCTFPAVIEKLGWS